jgi:hypothetical protein
MPEPPAIASRADIQKAFINGRSSAATRGLPDSMLPICGERRRPMIDDEELPDDVITYLNEERHKRQNRTTSDKREGAKREGNGLDAPVSSISLKRPERPR